MVEEIEKDPLLDDSVQVEDMQDTPTAPKEIKKRGRPSSITPSSVKVEAKVKVEYKDKIAETKAILEKKPHINFLIPLSEGEKSPAYDQVQINGYKLTVQKGILVNIPLPVANILAEKYRIIMETGSDKRIDRASDVVDALS